MRRRRRWVRTRLPCRACRRARAWRSPTRPQVFSSANEDGDESLDVIQFRRAMVRLQEEVASASMEHIGMSKYQLALILLAMLAVLVGLVGHGRAARRAGARESHPRWRRARSGLGQEARGGARDSAGEREREKKGERRE